MWSLNSSTSATLAHGNSPSIAFSREGWAMAVWSHYGDSIMYSIFNGTGWTSPGLVASAPENGSYFDPAVAFDEDGTGIAVWVHFDESGEYYTYHIRAKLWNSKEWVDEMEISHGELLNESGWVYPMLQIAPEVAFTSTKADKAISPRTPNKAVVVWWKDIERKTFRCEETEFSLPISWPHYSIWNGTGFSAPEEIPGRPAQPPYLVGCDKKMGVSPDQYGNAMAVWAPVFDPDPCAYGDERVEVWSAVWNGTTGNWEDSRELRDGGNTVDIAFQPNGIAVILDGNFPSIASLHFNHNKTIAVRWDWEDDQVEWSELDYTSPNSTWTPYQVLGAGGYPEIAAHIGSPTMPLAEWTYLAYLAADNNLHNYIINGDKNEVNVVTPTDPYGLPTKYEYIKRNNAVERKKTWVTKILVMLKYWKSF